MADREFIDAMKEVSHLDILFLQFEKLSSTSFPQRVLSATADAITAAGILVDTQQFAEPVNLQVASGPELRISIDKYEEVSARYDTWPMGPVLATGAEAAVLMELFWGNEIYVQKCRISIAPPHAVNVITRTYNNGWTDYELDPKDHPYPRVAEEFARQISHVMSHVVGPRPEMMLEPELLQRESSRFLHNECYPHDDAAGPIAAYLSDLESDAPHRVQTACASLVVTIAAEARLSNAVALHLADESELTRALAISALVVAGDQRGASALETVEPRVFSETSLQWMIEAVLEAGRRGRLSSPSRLGFFEAVSRDERFYVRKLACEALGKLGSRDAIPLLVDSLRREKEGPRRLPVLDDRDRLVQLIALVEDLEKNISADNAKAMIETLEELAQYANPEIDDLLLNLRDCSYESVMKVWINLVGWRRPPWATEELIDRWSASHGDDGELCAEWINEIHAANAAEQLTETIREDDDKGNVGHLRDCYQLLMKQLRSRSNSCAGLTEAAESLKKITGYECGGRIDLWAEVIR